MPRLGVPKEVAEIRKRLRECLDSKDEQGRCVSKAFGVYVFYDYDGEPIYVGRTWESLRQRIGRHLTNQRTDAVAMNVLDPFEVLDIEIWPFWELENFKGDKAKLNEILDRAEHTVYRRVLERSALKAVLNEKPIPEKESIALPPSYRFRIVPEEIYQLRKHPDIRIARRASTIANLARVISEREGSIGLRRALLTQARRLELLANQRLEGYAAAAPIGGKEGEIDDDEKMENDDEP